jgi:hypothetical protein
MFFHLAITNNKVVMPKICHQELALRFLVSAYLETDHKLVRDDRLLLTVKALNRHWFS